MYTQRVPVRRMVGAQVCSVVRWLFGCGLVVGGFDCAIVLSFLAMTGLCCCIRVTQRVHEIHDIHDTYHVHARMYSD